MRLTKKRFDTAVTVADEALATLNMASNILYNYAQHKLIPDKDRKYFDQKRKEFDKIQDRLRKKLRGVADE